MIPVWFVSSHSFAQIEIKRDSLTYIYVPFPLAIEFNWLNCSFIFFFHIKLLNHRSLMKWNVPFWLEEMYTHFICSCYHNSYVGFFVFRAVDSLSFLLSWEIMLYAFIYAWWISSWKTRWLLYSHVSLNAIIQNWNQNGIVA